MTGPCTGTGWAGGPGLCRQLLTESLNGVLCCLCPMARLLVYTLLLVLLLLLLLLLWLPRRASISATRYTRSRPAAVPRLPQLLAAPRPRLARVTVFTALYL